jgi:hypothetical protein
MLKEDPATYCLKLLTRFENEFGMESFVDYITIQPYSWFGIYSGSYVTDKHGNNTIYLPNTTDKELLKELFYHELGHSIYQNYKIPKYLTSLLNPILTEGFIEYRYRILANRSSERAEGMCSAYCLVDQEEEFCELVSLYMCNKGKKRFPYFNGIYIDLYQDKILKIKVKYIIKFLSKFKLRAQK